MHIIQPRRDPGSHTSTQPTTRLDPGSHTKPTRLDQGSPTGLHTIQPRSDPGAQSTRHDQGAHATRCDPGSHTTTRWDVGSQPSRWCDPESNTHPRCDPGSHTT